ncbi:Lipase maturation factor [Babesia microti strain RI]|uniref:Lipase maturation factor n=1 Tax=Babesia microti (strain RI) TaxID=1133968 RepID=I7J6K1_BABMR|nr:Lipase maturation factor [Babesia microti strain RI]CCF73857.1 Lipase maturation factor [Babesia microti strain RI]|eukprot:XP_012648466.1 Lipase maturation factor [Babesia microti strain RI]
MNGVKLVNKCPLNELSARTLSLNFITDTEENDLTESYNLSRTFFTRILGIVHFFYFLSIFNNILPLIGTKGLYPVSEVLSMISNELHTTHDFLKYLKKMPLLFIILPSNDFFLAYIPLVGIFTSFILILAGLANWIVMTIIFFLLHTCVYCMNTFNFNSSHMLILEVTFLAIFLHQPNGFKNNSGKWNTPWAVRWGFKLFVYKVLLGSGIGQIKTSKSWSELSAMHNLLNSITAPTSFSWFIGHIASNPTSDRTLTIWVLAIECIFSIFVITPIRGCRLLGFFITMVYSLFFYSLGGNPHLYLLLFASSLFLLDDKALSWIFCIDTDDNTDTAEIKSNDEYNISLSLSDAPQFFWKLFHNTPKVNELMITIPIIGFKVSYNDFIRKMVNVLGSKIIYIKQLVLIILMIVLLVTAKIHWAIYLIIPIMLFIHVLTDLANFFFAYITTFTVFFITALWLFVHLMIKHGTWEGVMIFVTFILLINSLGKSCDWHITVKKVFFEITFALFLTIGFSYFICNLTLKHTNFNKELLSYGLYNSIAAYPNVYKYRYEAIIIGSSDYKITKDSVWKEYDWKSKPGYIDNSPSHIISYERPLDDWIKVNHDDFKRLLVQSKEYKRAERLAVKWGVDKEFKNIVPLLVIPLLYKLSIGDEKIASLFANNPFPNGAKHLKVLIYAYHMSFESHNVNNRTNYTQKELDDMMDYAKKHNYDPKPGKYANYGNSWIRQPLLVFAEFDLEETNTGTTHPHEKHLKKRRAANIPLVPFSHPVYHSPSIRKHTDYSDTVDRSDDLEDSIDNTIVDDDIVS